METISATAPVKISTTSEIMKWGIILAILNIAYTSALYFTGQIFNKGLGWVTYLIMGVVVFLAVKSLRDVKLGGFISFQKAFTHALLIIIFSSLIYACYHFVFITYIAPDFIEKAINNAKQVLEDQGKTEAEIDMAMRMTSKLMNPAFIIGASILSITFFGAIISLIIAAICKKENKEILSPQ